MLKLTSEKKGYRCVCQREVINYSELGVHLLKPLSHKIIKLESKKSLNIITKNQIKQRINFIKSSSTQLSQINQITSQNIQIKSTTTIEKLKINLLIKPLNQKHSEINKNIKLFYNQHTLKIITNFKYLKNKIHKGINLFFKNHNHNIISFAIEENLNILVCGNMDGYVWIYSLKTLSQIACFFYHESSVNAIDIKSNHCITGSHDSKICLFNLKTKKLKKFFHSFHGPIMCLKFSINSGYFLSGSQKGYIGIWNILKKVLVFQIFVNSSVVFARFIQNDYFFIYSTYEGLIRRIELLQKTSALEKKFKGELLCSSLIEESEILITGHEDGFIQVLKKYQMFKTFKAHSNRINSIDHCLKSGKFVSGSVDNTLKVWSLSSFSLLTVLDHFEHQILCVKLLNNKIYSSSDKIEYFDLSIQRIIKTNTYNKYLTNIFSISIKLKLIVYGYERVYLHCLSLNSDICDRSFESKILHLAFASSVILCGTEKGFIYCVDIRFLEIKRKYFFGVSPILFIRVTKHWEVMCYSILNKSFVQDLRNLESLLTFNKEILFGKFRKNSFVFVDNKYELYVSNNFKTIRKINSKVNSFQLFWCRCEDYIIFKGYETDFFIINIKRQENEIKFGNFRGLKSYMKKKKQFSLSKGDMILSSHKFRSGFIN